VAIAALAPNLRRASFVPIAILGILVSLIVGAALFWVVVDQKPHRVLLRWDPPPKPAFAVAGYNVYRSPSHGAYEPIAFVTTTSYTDNHVHNRKTYHYMVKAVDANGRESPISNQVTVTIE
jgi:fibronectin type 3 domain-containing protein